MKKQWSLILIALLVSTYFLSCKNDSDAEWRDSNLSFIDKIGKQDGIKEISDTIFGKTGIYYKVLQEGTGKTPIGGNVVKVSYAGWLYKDTIDINKYANGTLDIDDSFDHSDNYKFTVGKSVIDGWSIAIQNMPVGSKWRIFIPYYLAYGTTGSGSIPAYSTLVFDISLKEIVSDN